VRRYDGFTRCRNGPAGGDDLFWGHNYRWLRRRYTLDTEDRYLVSVPVTELRNAEKALVIEKLRALSEACIGEAEELATF
jgi:hypothetical protein